MSCIIFFVVVVRNVSICYPEGVQYEYITVFSSDLNSSKYHYLHCILLVTNYYVSDNNDSSELIFNTISHRKGTTWVL
jgi:hypothetical protein